MAGFILPQGLGTEVRKKVDNTRSCAEMVRKSEDVMDAREAVRSLVEAKLAEAKDQTPYMYRNPDALGTAAYSTGLSHGTDNEKKNPFTKGSKMHHDYERGFAHAQRIYWAHLPQDTRTREESILSECDKHEYDSEGICKNCGHKREKRKSDLQKPQKILGKRD
jgi:hypothetical protein